MKTCSRVLRNSDLTVLERICREEWEKLPIYRCAKLVASYLRRLKDVIAAKGASTKHRVKVLKTFNMQMQYFHFTFFIHLHKFPKNGVPLSLWGIACRSMRKRL
jgi:hypothetical protein